MAWGGPTSHPRRMDDCLALSAYEQQLKVITGPDSVGFSGTVRGWNASGRGTSCGHGHVIDGAALAQPTLAA
jgi:hypothetical protein